MKTLPKEQFTNFASGEQQVDPGRNDPPIRCIPKVISGLDDVRPGSLEAITRLYNKVFDHVVPVSSPEVAEMVKLYENCQRMICIAYANEMADACGLHKIDPYEVCAAAATKPFGYMPFSPGVGVGGHCIPVNPYYLLANSHFPLLQAATETMRNRPAVLAARALDTLGVAVNSSLFPDPAPVGGLAVEGSGCLNSFEDVKVAEQAVHQQDQQRPRVLVVGVGFKSGQSHLSNSPGLALARSLKSSQKVDVAFADALVPQAAVSDIQRLADNDWCAATLEHRFDLIIVALKQVGMDFDELRYFRHTRVEMWCR
jgi:UDP-N-acetyl-D-mannosaminuronate dehydrogenase